MASLLWRGLARPAATASTLVHNTTTAPRPATLLRQPATINTLRLLSTTPALQKGGLRERAQHGRPRDNPPGEFLPVPTASCKSARIPEYPHGERRVYKQANRGLYGTSTLQFGNRVSDKHGNKTRRVWRLRVLRLPMYSLALGCFVQVRGPRRILKAIEYEGGLDEYLLADSPKRIRELGPWGWKLRWRLMQTAAVQARFDRERAELNRKWEVSQRKRTLYLPRVVRPYVEEGEAVESEGAEVQQQQQRQRQKAMYLGLPAPGEKDEQLMEETTRMLEGGEEFVLGPPEEVGKDEGFMKEDRP